MKTILKGMTDDDLTKVFEITSKMMKKYLTDAEYHQLFLKEEERWIIKTLLIPLSFQDFTENEEMRDAH